MLHATSVPPDDCQQVFQLPGITCEVDLRRVDDEQWAFGPVKEKPTVRLRNLLDVLERNELFLLLVASANASQQHLGSRRQIYHKIGPRNPRGEQPENLLIKSKFVGAERQTGVNPILLE